MKKFIIIAVLAVFYTVTALPQVNDFNSYALSDTLEDFGLFTRDEVFDLSLAFDVTSYMRKKPKEEYIDAVMTYHLGPGDSITHNIKLKSRGEFRNGYCTFPPLQLNFKKADFAKKDLEKINKIKVVTHCQSGNEDLLFREYLIYKLYNTLTDSSFRVRLVRMTYLNTFKQTKPIRTYAFFIEPAEILADRLNLMPVELTTLSQKNIEPSMMDRMAVFNYMIGNTDWSVPNQHNCKIFVGLGTGRSDLGLIVPYDFDYSGLVNAPYAIPHENLGIESVRERKYLGICRDEQTFLKTLKEFRDKKEAMYRVISDFPYLNEKEKKDMIMYLEGFFSRFDRRNTIVYDLLNQCKEL